MPLTLELEIAILLFLGTLVGAVGSYALGLGRRHSRQDSAEKELEQVKCKLETLNTSVIRITTKLDNGLLRQVAAIDDKVDTINTRLSLCEGIIHEWDSRLINKEG